jgi:undecaprenyl-diphosphatase
MPIWLAVVLGIVEGLTEYLPVSSTGHLIVVGRALGLEKTDANDAFEVVIQLGAILAVFVHYRSLLARHAAGLLTRKPESVRLATSIVIAAVPFVILAKLFGHAIKDKLFAPVPVAIALILGGIVMFVVERVRKARSSHGLDGIEHVTPTRALMVGLGQCFALFPGTSRSMSSIVAGQLSGLSTRTAAEFSFLVGLPVLGGATVYEGYKSRHALMHDVGLPSIVIGIVVSFFVAWAVIATFLRYLGKRGLEPFGIYRIVLGIVVLYVMGK